MTLQLPGYGRALLFLAALALPIPLMIYSVNTYRAHLFAEQAREHLPYARYDAAVELFDRARALTPGDADLAREMGGVYVLMNAFRPGQGYGARALEALQEAAELNPLDGRNFNELGWALMSQGRLEEAEGAFRKALERDPYNVHNIYSLGRLHERRGELEAAVAEYERALAVKGDRAVRARLERVRGKL